MGIYLNSMKKGDIVIAGLWLLGFVVGWELKEPNGLLINLLIGFLASLWAIIDVVRAKTNIGDKISWIIFCLPLGLIGATIYYIFRVRKKKIGKT